MYYLCYFFMFFYQCDEEVLCIGIVVFFYYYVLIMVQELYDGFMVSKEVFEYLFSVVVEVAGFFQVSFFFECFYRVWREKVEIVDMFCDIIDMVFQGIVLFFKESMKLLEVNICNVLVVVVQFDVKYMFVCK